MKRQNSKVMAPEVVFSNASDRTDFMKFTKFLALKGVQIIVHSRKGAKVETNCKIPSSDTDWFNLAIQDSVEVTKATKKAFLGDILSTFRSQLCVEISLRTTDGDEMVLETWIFGINPKEPDYTLKAMSTVYYRMGILLKSLISVTRITPAYKLAKSPESYSIYYQVYTGEPRIECLGEDSKKVSVGMLRTPIGGLLISLVYRTNMIISPNKQKNNLLLLKSDHFELSPKHIVYDHDKKKEVKEKTTIDLNKPLRPAAFVDIEVVEGIINAFHEKLPRPKVRSASKYSTANSQASASQPVLTHPKIQNESREQKSPTPIEVPPRRFSWFRSEHEPPLKLLQCPFADKNPINDLAEFYKDFFNAPHLKLTEDAPESLGDNSSETIPSHSEQSAEKVDLSKEFEEFEHDIQEFDDMVASMYYCSDGN